MWIELVARLGLRGTKSPIASVYLDAKTVGNEADLLGAYHILSMDQQYDAYVVTHFLPQLPPILNFPVAHPYLAVSQKIRAAGVTGNIGEAIAALIARRVIQLNIADIAHIQPASGKKKSPDYMMYAGPKLPGPLWKIWPAAISTWPDWWPVESKARDTKWSVAAAVKSGFKQLAAYWHAVSFPDPDAVGFGAVASFAYAHRTKKSAKVTRQLMLSIFLPRDQFAIRGQIASMEMEAFAAGAIQNRVLRGAMYGC